MSFASESGDSSSDSNNQSNGPKAEPILAAGKFYGNEFGKVNPSLFAER